MNKGKGENPHFQVAGAGNVVTLLHGMGASLDTWEKQVSRLSKNYKIITPNTRGFGKNPGVSIYTMDTWVEDIYNLLAALKIEKTCLVGFSMGGLLAARFALRFPEFLQGLVFVGSLGEMSETSIQMFQSRAELAKKQGIEPIVEMKPEIRLIPNVIRSYRRLPSPEPAIF